MFHSHERDENDTQKSPENQSNLIQYHTHTHTYTHTHTHTHTHTF